MKKLFLFLALFFMPLPASAASYYVAPAGSGGSDSNNGAIGTPFLTPQKCADVAVAGDTCNFRAGTYTGAVGGNVLTATTSGTSGNPITFQNYSGEAVVFQCGSTHDSTWDDAAQNPIGPYPEAGARLVGNYLTIKADVVGNFRLGGTIGVTETLNNPRCYSGVKITGSNATVQNLETQYAWSHGIDGEGISNAVISGNKVHDNNQVNWPRGEACCGAGTRNRSWGNGMALGASHDINVYDNYVYWNHGEGIGLGLKGYNQTVRNNVVGDNWSVNIYVDGARDPANGMIDGNFVYTSDDAKAWSVPAGYEGFNDAIGIGLSSEAVSEGGPINGQIVINNTVVNTSGGVVAFKNQQLVAWSNITIIGNTFVKTSSAIQLRNFEGASSAGISNVKIRNNIGTNLVGYLMNLNPQPTASTYSHNIFHGAVSTSSIAGVEKTFAQTEALLSMTDSLFVSPQLIDQTAIPPRFWSAVGLSAPSAIVSRTTLGANYHIPTGSPAKDAGVNLGAPFGFDFDGIARGIGAGWDVGAFEFQTGAATWVLTVNSVNPASGVAMNLDPAGTGGDCDGNTPVTCTYNDLQVGTVTAPATSGGQTFSSWTGDCTSAVGTLCNFTMASARTVTANYSSPLGLVAWWKLDEAKDATAVDSGDAPANNGTLTGGPTWTTERGRSTVTFDGVNDSINVAAAASLSFHLTNAFTIRATVKPTVPGGSQAIIENTTWFIYASLPGYCGTSGATLMGFLATTQYWTVCDPIPLVTTVPTRLGFTYDGTTLVMYKNGLAITTTPSSAVILDGTASATYIGASQFGENFTGEIWDVRLNDYALTAAEMLTDHPAAISFGGAMSFGPGMTFR